MKRVVSASSASIYGQAEEFPTTEKHHGYGNRTIYGATKSYSEGLLRSFYEMYGLNYVALRYFNVYGPRMDAFGVYTEVMIRWMERLAKGQPCLILGDGAQTMDFVFVTDIARANLMAAQFVDHRRRAEHRQRNGDQPRPNWPTALGRVMGVDLPPEYGPARKATPVWRRLADVKKAERLIGFRAQRVARRGPPRSSCSGGRRETGTVVNRSCIETPPGTTRRHVLAPTLSARCPPCGRLSRGRIRTFAALIRVRGISPEDLKLFAQSHLTRRALSVQQRIKPRIVGPARAHGLGCKFKAPFHLRLGSGL